MVVPISYVDSQSTIREINIDLNTALETDVVGDDVYHSSDPFDHKVDSDSDPDVNKVLDDIHDEVVNDDGNINESSVGNQIRRIVIHNNSEAHMSRVDPNQEHATKFREYSEILPTHWLAVDSDPEELFVGQGFKSKGKCVFSIKRYGMNISVEYKFSMSKRHYILESVGGRWKAAIGGDELHLSRSCKCGRYKNLLGFTYALQHI
ncbi:hypothetical protein GOBAR_AA31121 [Gossypium barbadense]|uniref:Transposase MuDR plant domain-containing protein n=1 Tax=Gossypium barbadense TaxID=3634 RepID=A0A2P5WEP7_GOSBA|nr:hypothetical protein GOBAR_AA31121 [Gossypium barbadense]